MFVETVCRRARNHCPDFPELASPVELHRFLKTGFADLKVRHPRRDHPGHYQNELYCGDGVEIEPYVLISGKVVLGDNVKVGPFTFLRGPLVVGDGTRIGPHNEVQRCLIGSRCKISHKNFVSDCVIGDGAHLGNNVTTAVQSARGFVKVRYGEQTEVTQEKYGALIEDGVKLLGTISVMPGAHLPANCNFLTHCIVYGRGMARTLIGPKVKPEGGR